MTFKIILLIVVVSLLCIGCYSTGFDAGIESQHSLILDAYDNGIAAQKLFDDTLVDHSVYRCRSTDSIDSNQGYCIYVKKIDNTTDHVRVISYRGYLLYDGDVAGAYIKGWFD